jgi:hypothetical protein
MGADRGWVFRPSAPGQHPRNTMVSSSQPDVAVASSQLWCVLVGTCFPVRIDPASGKAALCAVMKASTMASHPAHAVSASKGCWPMRRVCRRRCGGRHIGAVPLGAAAAEPGRRSRRYGALMMRLGGPDRPRLCAPNCPQRGRPNPSAKHGCTGGSSCSAAWRSLPLTLPRRSSLDSIVLGGRMCLVPLPIWLA